MRSNDLSRAFLKKSNARPLYGLMWEPMIEPAEDACGNTGHTGMQIKPQDVCAKAMVGTAAQICRHLNELETDLPFAFQACNGNQWLEAILHCKIVQAKNAVWAKPPHGAALDTFLREPPDGEWAQKLLECHCAMSEWAGGVRFCAVPLLHGPLDALVAYLGVETVGYAFYDEPNRLRQCLEKATDVYISVAKMLIASQSPVMGGYASRMHIFTELPSVTMQNDASYMTSPALFDAFLLPLERRIVAELPCTVYHMHNTSLHLWERIAGLGCAAVQVSVDPNGPPLAEQVAIYRKMQQSVPLMLSCWSTAQMDELAMRLRPEGLCLTLIPALQESRPGADGGFRGMEAWNAYCRARTGG